MSIEDVLKSMVTRVGIVRVRNALNPLLWSMATLAAATLIAAALAGVDTWLALGLFGLTGLFAIGNLVAFFYFMVKNPDRLQSEEFVLRHLEIVYERKGLPPLIAADQLPNDPETLESVKRPSQDKQGTS